MEIGNSSNELEMIDQGSSINKALTNNFITEMKRHYDDNCRREVRNVNRTPERYHKDRRDRECEGKHRRSADVGGPIDRVDQMIQNAEANRMKIFGTPGRDHNTLLPIDLDRDFIHSAMVDETYMLVASHIEDLILGKIERGEFVDFTKLIPKDKIMAEEETELKLIMREGRTFYVPVKDSTNISSFSRWEQAFRVFSNIYLRRNPLRATELIQYNHVIHSASLIYVWSNIHAYDQDFRIHMSKHPGHSWAILLQQSWSMRLQEKIRGTEFHQQFSSNKNARRSGSFEKKGNGELCRKFNRGKCTFGPSCKFEHRCSYCFKFRHAAIHCRKAIPDRQDNMDCHGSRDAGNKSRRSSNQ